MDRKDRKKGEKRLAEGWSSLPTYHLLFPHSVKISGGMRVKMRRIRLFLSCPVSTASVFCSAMVLLFLLDLLLVVVVYSQEPLLQTVWFLTGTFKWFQKIVSVAVGGNILYHDTWHCKITCCIIFSCPFPWPSRLLDLSHGLLCLSKTLFKHLTSCQTISLFISALLAALQYWGYQSLLLLNEQMSPMTNYLSTNCKRSLETIWSALSQTCVQAGLRPVPPACQTEPLREV